MNIPDTDRLRSIFDAAADLQREDRADFVRKACDGDAALEREVISLLNSLETRWTSDLDTAVSAFSEGAADILPLDESLPSIQMGGFRLRRVIGRGATGTVCEAEQDQPRRLVAIKILSAWNVGRDVRRRFVAEAEILARLDHPGIARVIAAGTYDLGVHQGAGPLHELLGSSPTVPWLAMELVEHARTLTVFAHEQALGVRERVELLAKVCDAVHAGHLMGVIHRDLKPANVLVTTAGQPKVIDFGVAKSLASDYDHAAHTMATSAAPIIGTLAYMSPEQVDGRAQFADVRTDVYALGVILYELITGRRPHSLDSDSFSKSAQIINTESPKPPRSIVPAIDPDLDTIICKSLEKEPDSRYQSAADLADDLRRLLANRPINARRPSAAYTLRKWIRRHPARAVLAMLSILAVLIGVGGIAVGLARESEARAQADLQGRLANLRAADFALQLGDAATAKSCLAAVPPRLRGWEWSYLVGQTDTSRSVADLRPLAGTRGVAQPTPTTRLALFLHDHDVQAIDIENRSIAWTAQCDPSRSNVEYSADGQTVLVPGIRESVVLQLDTGKVVARLAHPIAGLAFGGSFDPSGRYVAVGGERFVAQFDARTGEVHRQWKIDGSVYGAAFDSAGRRLAWSDVRDIVIVDALDGDELRRIPTSRRTIWEPSFLRWSSDDRLLMTTSDTSIELFDANSPENAPIRRIDAGAQRITFIEFTPDNRLMIAASKDSAVRAWDLAAANPARVLIGHEHPVTMFRTLLGDQGETVIRSVDSQCVLRKWAVHPSRTPLVFSTTTGPGGGFVSSLSWIPDVNAIVSGTYGGGIEYHTSGPAAAHQSVRFETPLGANSCSKSGTRALAISTDGTLHGINLSQGRIDWRRPLAHPHDACALTPDGSLGAIGSLNGILTIVDAANGRELRSVACRQSQVARIAFTSTGELLIIAFNDGSLELWSSAQLERLRVIHAETPNSLAIFAISADDQWIAFASGGDAGDLLIERLRDGAERRTLCSLGTFIWSMAFSPDSTRLAVGGQDRQTRILEFPGGQELLRLRDHQGSVMCLAWSDDGSTLLSGGYDQRIGVHHGARASQGHSTVVDAAAGSTPTLMKTSTK